MANIKDITTMCKAGNIEEAYKITKDEFVTSPQDIWVQRALGWALYYKIKEDVEQQKTSDLYNHLQELSELEMLTVENDKLIFDNVLWKVACFVKDISDKESVEEIDRLFLIIRKYSFTPSKGYSFLLKSYIKYETWPKMVDFLEWWNIDNMLDEDYHSYQMDNGRKIMSLAEQVYIAYSKALLKLNDKEKIQSFIPQIEQIIDKYPEMVYPGYFCGKLMLAMGAERDEALDIVMPFARKKKSEFWVWQLIGDIYDEDDTIQLACYLRGVYCCSKENFLGKLRIKLATLYIEKKDYPRAKYHIEKVVQCYENNGWRLPREIQIWLQYDNIRTATSDSSDGVDYKLYTNNILRIGANESVAVVTYVDNTAKRAILVYGLKKRASVKLADLKVKVKAGTLLKIYWVEEKEGRLNVLGADIKNLSDIENLSYIKRLEGTVIKRNDQSFAFLNTNDVKCYINPTQVENNKLNNGNVVSVLSVLDYNKKKGEWAWVCVALKKENM